MSKINTLFVGKVLYHYRELDSTNSRALELLSKSKPSEGTAISAAFQRAGRGQIGSRWESAPGENLCLSVILYPSFILARRQFALNQAVALAVAETVALYAPVSDVAIKWPNDIYVKDKKVGGILLQNSLSGVNILHSVAGIGLNVNQVDFPAGLPNPTSLALETGGSYELEALRDRLFENLEKWYLRLRSGDEAALSDPYLRRLYRYRMESCFELPDGSRFAGTITGLTDTGKLVVDREGEELSFGFKEVAFCR
ncbi:MAG: biotin--[acetyl-CoA-carboxylase] ligase [Saprospiraceae bacterium]|nr:biotin--[acetyl-CoA-carboxylase] ligase [Saprospiraceae bacterium]MCB0625317.1 biotin--[acetyl-CoA-carboxylase] ligase [Saprospiraceae bacterium]MCB0679860.1 biotin--[acetyl-CoA-carboxylase] ligase [Saprospiraceae bacterium]